MNKSNVSLCTKLLAAIVVISSFSSCATIFSGKKQKVDVTTYPAGARVYVDSKDQMVITPATVKIPRKKKVAITFIKEGYKDETVTQKGSINPVTWGNIIIGGIPGWLIDWGTGSIYKYPNEISCNLTEGAGSTVAPLPTPTPTQQVDPTIVEGEEKNMVTRDAPGATALERTIIRWYFDSAPQGARLYWRVISSIPSVVKNTNELYLAPTPYEETRSFNILGLTYENSRDVTIEIRARKAGYLDQVKRFNVRQAIDQQEISSFFELVKAEE
ncbi:PEGA domain-containing protein [uncultured Bacteroides sp.]|uniref:PEGA domain-containing protein n=1 Tax=uncultured Bacteroides sp. TaxID=162156 RepID=UPI00261CFD10|nr:PEGA domain-containing protein [uncultured Bacteroides sp.]